MVMVESGRTKSGQKLRVFLTEYRAQVPQDDPPALQYLVMYS
jgi:hypothetical protein